MKTFVAVPVLLGLVPLHGLASGGDAESLVASSGIEGGLIVHVGCGDGQFTAGLHVSNSYIVHGLDADMARVTQARAHVKSLGIYGPVSIDQIRGSRLPYCDNLVNLLVISDPSSVSPDERHRVLAPGGVVCVKEDGRWQQAREPWPETIDEWTHHLHDASGNAVARDQLVGPPRHLQWNAGPQWARSHGWTPSVSAMVSSGGRLFAICDETPSGVGDAVPSKWFLVARDAFSGVLLWKQPISQWGAEAMSGTPDNSGGGVSTGRFTMPTHTGKRLVAVGDTVYVTLGAHAPVSALDAATGRIKQVYSETARADELLFCDGRLIVSINPPTSARPAVVPKEETPPPAPGKQVCAIDTGSGETLWTAGPFAGIRAGRSQDPFGRLELCAGDGRVFLLTTDAVHCLQLDSGEELWRLDRPALPANAVRKLGFSGMYEYQLTVLVYQDGVLLLAQPEPNTHHTYHTMPGALYAFDASDGSMLWKQEYGGWGHCTPPDVFVIDGSVWCHVDVPTEYGRVWGNGYRALDTSKVDYRIQSLDLKTGQLRQEISTKDIFNVGHHHRCYRNKITQRYLMSSRRGVEFVDLESGENYQNHWVRSGCKVGNLPCNGLLYVAPHPCGCYIDAKLTGFNALAATCQTEAEPIRERLERGPAYGTVPSIQPGDSDWPTFRHDPRRSGATPTTITSAPKIVWTAEIGVRPGAPVVADGRLLVPGVDAHTVFALDAQSGQRQWSFTAGARVKSPPTFYQGLALFGSNDGCVYCLRSSDGQLVWRFQAAPARRLVTVSNQLESAWPVPGVLVRDGKCWFAAGRSSYLDGGLVAYVLNAVTGEVLHEQVVYSPDPETGKMKPEPSGQQLAGLLNDIPGSDGSRVFIRQMCLSGEGQGDPRRHLFTTAGYLDSSWFNRTFWKIGKAQTTGPMVLGDEVAFGVEPFTSRSRDVLIQPGRHPYRLRCLPVSPPAVAKVDRRGNKVARQGQPKTLWDQRLQMRPTALVRAGTRVLVGGFPDVVDPDDPYGAWEGRKGGGLAMFSTEDGAPIAELKLPAPPVWDGMAVAGNRLYVALRNGTVVCLE